MNKPNQVSNLSTDSDDLDAVASTQQYFMQCTRYWRLVAIEITRFNEGRYE
jgi:hypothetical protein